ncbi:hypothetical protein [Catellatospora citrea]|uniref:Uncharacterized protein n=1 Tax=Catellatospora citrea TaxID=53366 RepID=A0A8J3P1W7_9ACTN|nr:hypothetical protein [Catellatospora citrea]RKE10556.1 hypothetical protein C8E86_5468 [Catellatospora citrea]GIF98780.1 hypothetical protein Cci01nite_38740 [Catellatospora citrea]
MSTVTSQQLAGFAQLLFCVGCRRRMREVTGGAARVFQCTAGCRRQPVDATWLEEQVKRALAGRVALVRAAEAVTAITVARHGPPGVGVRWRNDRWIGRQPDTSGRPTTVFAPARRPHA